MDVFPSGEYAHRDGRTTGTHDIERGEVRPGGRLFRSGAGNGSTAHAAPFRYYGVDGYDLAQWQESGRDQGHSMMGMGQLGAICEMAWSQGVDRYGHDNYRFMHAAQYVAKWLWQDFSFAP